MITMESIRQQYSHPTIPSRFHHGTEYCVGDAVCRVAFPTRPANFPVARTIAQALRKLNPGLGRRLAVRAAYDIMGDNDREDFASAWGVVKLALQPKETR